MSDGQDDLNDQVDHLEGEIIKQVVCWLVADTNPLISMRKKMYLASATGYIVQAYQTPDRLQAKDSDGLHGSVVAEITLRWRVLGSVVCRVIVSITM